MNILATMQHWPMSSQTWCKLIKACLGIRKLLIFGHFLLFTIEHITFPNHKDQACQAKTWVQSEDFCRLLNHIMLNELSMRCYIQLFNRLHLACIMFQLRQLGSLLCDNICLMLVMYLLPLASPNLISIHPAIILMLWYSHLYSVASSPGRQWRKH